MYFKFSSSHEVDILKRDFGMLGSINKGQVNSESYLLKCVDEGKDI